MTIKWYCKHCPLFGELEAPITVQSAYLQMADKHAETRKRHVIGSGAVVESCPAGTSTHAMVVADLDAEDMLCADGSIARNGRDQQIKLFLLAVQ